MIKMELNILIFTREEWAEACGLAESDMVEEYGNAVEFYSVEESAIAGCKYPDGTFGAFGCREDVKNITLGEMVEYIKGGM